MSVCLAILLLAVVGVLGFTNYQIGQRRQKLLAQVSALQAQVKDAQQKSKDLNVKISQPGNTDYVEKVAREQMGLKAPGEQEVVIYNDQNNPTTTSNLQSASGQSQKISWWDNFKSWLKNLQEKLRE